MSDMVITGVVNDFIDSETAEQRGKNKQREEREQRMAAEAELEKLVDKDWRERMFPHVPTSCFLEGLIGGCRLVE
jgi:hypothetical protein